MSERAGSGNSSDSANARPCGQGSSLDYKPAQETKEEKVENVVDDVHLVSPCAEIYRLVVGGEEAKVRIGRSV